MTIPKTVEEWYKLNQYEVRPANRLEAYGIIWDAAVAAERERCAQIAEGCQFGGYVDGVYVPSIAAAIRADTQP